MVMVRRPSLVFGALKRAALPSSAQAIFPAQRTASHAGRQRHRRDRIERKVASAQRIAHDFDLAFADNLDLALRNARRVYQRGWVLR
jgi:hypothetical protein